MTRRRTRPLGLEVVEDRALPSTFHGGPGLAAHEAHRAEFSFGPDRAEPIRPRAERIEAAAIFWIPMSWGSSEAAESAPPRSARPSESLRLVAEQAESPAAVAQARAMSTAQPISVALPSGVGQAAVTPNAAAAVSEQAATSAPAAQDAPRPAAADAPAAGFVFHGSVAVPDDTAFPDVVLTPVPPAAVPTPTELPSPREAIARVIEAVLPVGVPLAGVVPFETEAFDAAADLIAKLPGLAPDGGTTKGWASPERWAWVTAGVLVAGGAAYAAHGAGARRTTVPALGADSALARWEDRRGRKPA